MLAIEITVVLVGILVVIGWIATDREVYRGSATIRRSDESGSGSRRKKAFVFPDDNSIVLAVNLSRVQYDSLFGRLMLACCESCDSCERGLSEPVLSTTMWYGAKAKREIILRRRLFGRARLQFLDSKIETFR